VDVTIDAEIRRDLGFSLPPCDPPGNGMPIHYVLNAALDHLDRWASHSAEQARVRRRSVGVPAGESGGPAGGRMIRSSASRVAPPSWPPIVVRGDPPEIERDGFGNALGGIRLPQIEVPIAQYGPVGMPESLRCDLRGFTIPFPESLLAMLYPDHRTYVQKIRAVTLAAVHAGFVLPIDARDIERMAEAAAIP
jgi:hypothetical protein